MSDHCFWCHQVNPWPVFGMLGVFVSLAVAMITEMPLSWPIMIPIEWVKYRIRRAKRKHL